MKTCINSLTISRQHNDLQALQSRLEELEDALNSSLQNQRALQENVAFLLESDAVLRAQLEEVEETSQDKLTSISKELDKRTQQLESLKRKTTELGQLLEQSRQALESREVQLQEKDASIRRLQSLLREQKKVIQSLQSDRLYNNLSSLSYRQDKTPEKPDTYELQQRYEKQIVDLEYQLKRTEQALNNDRVKSDRIERENTEFRRWLNKMVGVERAVPGCEKVIMKEIEKRLNATAQ